jgi:MoxR-like ATPase
MNFVDSSHLTSSSEASASERAMKLAQSLLTSLEQVIKGQKTTLELVVTALISDGHALLEDYPGSGKTTLAKTLGRLIASPPDSPFASFRRIQFTPDMLPGDVLGVTIFDAKTSKFRFSPGPIFAHVVLADELNRAGPKVQSAFLESMAERQVTIDTTTYPLDPFFFVLGTQNPLDMAGTYPLPLVQLDRFLMKVPMGYVDEKTELEILERHTDIKRGSESIPPICTRDDILSARLACEHIYLHPALREAIVTLLQDTRKTPLLQLGASTRAALMLQSALRGWALIHGREHVIEDDFLTITPYVLAHRMKFHSGALKPHDVLQKLMEPIVEKLIRKMR